MTAPMGQHPLPQHTILHVSDTHFVGAVDGGKLHDVIDSDANLAQLFRGLEQSSVQPEAIVFTGDLADQGRDDAYARLRAMVEPAAARLGAEVIWVMGNHDDRREFRKGLLDGEPTLESYDRVHDVNGLRVIALDSTVPGQHYGEIDDAQLAWLRDVLATPAPHGTLIALHHPPVPSPLGLIALVELREQDRLADAIRGTDVRGVLGGHLHYSTVSTFAGGIPVSVAGATCYAQDLQVVYPAARGVDGGQSYNLVNVYEDRVLHSVIPIGAFPTVYEMTPEVLERFMAMSAEQQLAAVNASVHSEDVEPLEPVGVGE